MLLTIYPKNLIKNRKDIHVNISKLAGEYLRFEARENLRYPLRRSVLIFLSKKHNDLLSADNFGDFLEILENNIRKGVKI